MSKGDIERFVQMTAGIALAVFGALVWAFDSMRLGSKTFDRASSAISATAVFWLFFARWGWKHWPLNLLFNRPNVSGTWIGHLESDWQSATTHPRITVPIAFAIRQTFFSLQICSLTKDREGLSDVANLIVMKASDVTYLSYVYSLREEFRAGMGTQQGAAELRLVKGALPELKGEYWTNTKTSGRLILRRCSNDLVASFDSARQKWPVAQWPTFD
jgi:hypothetical protein